MTSRGGLLSQRPALALSLTLVISVVLALVTGIVTGVMASRGNSHPTIRRVPTAIPASSATASPAAQQSQSSPVLFPTGPFGVSVASDVAYGPLPDETLDLCSPVGVTGLRPAILTFHSSGFAGSDKRDSDVAPSCGHFASQGFVVANINYRLAPQNTWPAQLVDAQLAVRWLRAHAALYGVDAARVCAQGFSFGGYLAVYLGVLHTIHPGDQAALYADQRPDVSCVSDFFGLATLEPPDAEVTDDLQTTRLGLLAGATPDSDPNLYRDASPLFNVSPQSAPMVIVQGTHDGTVPPSQSLALKQALEDAGVPVTYISYDGDHELVGLDDAGLLRLWTEVLAFHVAYQQP